MYNGHLSIEEIEELIQQQKGPAENQRHVEACPQCKSLLEESQAISAKLEKLASVHIGAENAMNCPDPRVWFDVAAGTLPESQSLQYTQHASECQSCGKKLAAATRMFADELTPEEAKALASLPSSKVNAQRELAQRLAQVAGEQPRPATIKSRRRSWRRLSYAFATAAVIALVGFFSFSALTDSLLARGYTERGTLEYRIAKADPPKEGTRGVEEKERPVSLVIADLLIRSRLAISSKSAYWLARKGRLALIEGKADAALDALKQAHKLDPSSKIITIDLASALVFHYSGHQQQPTELFQAEDELLKILPSDPNNIEDLKRDSNNLIAIYNLAIIYEMAGSLDQAQRTWELYLKLDSNSPWAAQARERLENLRKQKHGRAPPAANAAISDWLSYLDSGEQSAAEAALDVALLEWLPKRGAKSTELEKLLLALAAKLEEQHGDNWLLAVLTKDPDVNVDAGFRALKNAIADNASGDFDSAVREAAIAQSVFRKVGSMAGLVRAQLEEVYSDQRATKGESCIHAAQGLENNLRYGNFLWIRIQLYLDEAGCFNVLGRLQEAKHAAEEGSVQAEQSRYRILVLRANGIEASQATTRGDRDSALAKDIEGLRTASISWNPPERAYQFYSDISFNTEALDLWHVTYEITGESVSLMAQGSHRELEAAARYRVAKFAVILGKNDEANLQIEQADRLFAALPEISATHTYRLDGILGLVKAEMIVGHDQQAATRVQESVGQFPAAESKILARRLAQIRGGIALKRGLTSEADSEYTLAVSIAESSLRELRTLRERFLWNRDNKSSYKALVQVKLMQEDAAAALAVWETYKAALNRKSPAPTASLSTVPDSFQIEYRDALAIEKAMQSERASSEMLVSYAFLPNGLAAWVLDAGGITVKELSIRPSDVRSLSARFAKECADQNSDLEQLRLDAKALYHVLLAPFSDRLLKAKAVIIEPDEDLGSVPFEALIDDSGAYLDENLALVYSPGILFQKYLRGIRPISAADRALIIGSPLISLRWQGILPPLPSANAEAKVIAAKFRTAVLLTGSAASLPSLQTSLPNTNIFHFAGHSVQTHNGAALVLTPTPDSRGADNDLLAFSDIPANKLHGLKLVVLSACSTGAGLDDNPDGIVDPLLLAGVPQTIVTRWRIDSAATLMFMQSLYHQILSGQPLSSSLSKAAEIMRTAMSHPYYWAGFKLLSPFAGGKNTGLPF